MTLRRAALFALCLYALVFSVFCAIALKRDAAMRSSPAAMQTLDLSKQLAFRLDDLPILDEQALAESLPARPFLESPGVKPSVGLQIFKGRYLWLRAQLPQLPSGDGEWTLWLDDRFARQARLVVVRDGQSLVREWQYGDSAHPGSEVKAMPVFHLPPGTLSGATVYFAISAYGGLRGDLKLAPRAVFGAEMFSRTVLLTFINGGVGVLAFFLGAIALRLKDKAMGYAAGIAFFTASRNFAETGAHVAVLFPANPQLADVVLYGTQPVAMSFWLLFTLAFVGLKERAPRIDALVKTIALILPLQGLLIVLKGGFWPEMPFNTSATFPTFLGIFAGFGVLFWQVAAGNKRAFFFMVCWTPLALGLSLRMTSYLFPALDLQLGILSRAGLDTGLSILFLAILLTIDLQEREKKLTRIAETNEQRARDYAEIGSDGVFEAGADGIISSSAGPLSRTLGLFPGTNVAARLPGLPQTVGQSMLTAPLRGHEFRLEGSEPLVWLSLSSVPVRGEDGAPAGLRAVASDISASIAARDSEERRNTLAALGQLAGGIAHEVNNLLHPIINLSRRVSDRHVGDPDGKRLMELVVTSGVRAGEIVRQVLRAYSPQGFSGVPVPLSRAVTDAVETIRATLPATCNLDAAIAPVDTPLVRSGEAIQILSNLANNALRAMGGVGTIAVRLTDQGSHIELVFADTGPGMTEDMRALALKPFVTGSKDGIGLGLSIVHRVVSDWKGTIAIRSDPGQGVTFTITLPKTMGPPAQ